MLLIKGSPFNSRIRIVYCTNSIIELGQMRPMAVRGLSRFTYVF